MGPVKKFFHQKKSKAAPTNTTRENAKKTLTGKDTSELLTLFPPSSNFSGNFREFFQSLREYLNKNYPKLTHLLDVGGILYEKVKLLSKKKEKKLSQTQIDVVKAQNRQIMSENETIKEDAGKIFQIILGNLSTDSVRKIQEKVAEGIDPITASGSYIETPKYLPYTWDDFLANRDLSHLWTAIRSTHIGCVTGIPVLDMIEYTINLLTLVQESNQSPSQFQQVLEQINCGLPNVGNGSLRPLPENFMAGLLFRNLSNDYSEVQTYLVNQCLLGIMNFPNTTAEVLSVVEKYVSENRSVFIQQTDNNINTSENPLKRKLDAADAAKKKLQLQVESLKKELGSPAKSSGKSNHGASNGPKKSSPMQQPPKDAKPSKPCGHCSGWHYSFYCEKMTKDERNEHLERWLAAQKAKSVDKPTPGSKKVYFTKTTYDIDDPLSDSFVRGVVEPVAGEDVDGAVGIQVSKDNVNLFFTGEVTDFIEGPPAELTEDSSDESVAHGELLAKVHTVLSTSDTAFNNILLDQVDKSSVDELRGMLRLAYDRSVTKTEKLVAIAKVYPDALIFDPGSQASIAKDKFYLENIRSCRRVRINNERIISQKGTNAFFGDMLYDPTFIANLISMSEILDRGLEVAWVSKTQVFVVSNPTTGNSIEFVRVGGLWVADAVDLADLKDVEVNFQTVDDRMKQFSNRANEQAKLAYDFMNARQLSVKDATNLVQSVVGSPFSAIDFKRAEWIWGPAESLRSRNKTTKPMPLDVEKHLSSIQSVALSVDLMFMYDMVFLVSQSTPLNIKQCTAIKSRKRQDVLKALGKHLSVFKRYNRLIEILLSDGEGAIVSMETRVSALHEKLDSFQLNVEAAGSHVPYVENLISYVKAKVRGFTNTSPLEEMPKALFAMIVCSTVESLNYLSCSSNHNGISPWEALTQQRPTFDRYFQIAPGQFAWVVEPRPEVGYSKVDFDRMIPAIALGPTGSIRNAYKFVSLETGNVITRDKFKIGVITHEIIQKVKSFDGDELLITDQVLDSEEDTEFLQQTHTVHKFNSLNNVIQSTNQLDTTPQVASYQPQLHLDMSSHDRFLLGDSEISNFNRNSKPRISLPPSSMVTRSSSNFKFVNLTYAKAKKKLGDEVVEQPVIDEIHQLLVDKGVLIPANSKDLSEQDILDAVHTHMLVDEKFHQDGSLDKVKARLVAMGCDENPANIGESFAPTPFIQHIFALCAIAAKNKCKVRTLDISGAFLNASYLHKRQYVILNKQLAEVVCKINPAYRSCLRNNGTLYCRLQKALYGLTEAAKLWNDEVAKVMISAGFKPSFIDSCVFTKTIDGSLCTVIVHVDDFKIMSIHTAALDFVENLMREKFKKITVKNDLKHDFLGMTFDYSEEGFVHITQPKFIREIIQMADVNKESENPAIPNLFYANDNSPLLVEKERKKLHTLVCKAQYLANRTRPDILPVAHFLSRRVNRLTEEDKEKMVQMAEYLFHSKQLGLRLGVVGDLRVTVYIDASYATHNDRKSQTGMCMTLGCGMIYSISKRQKINTKSACEAELVGLSDSLGIPIQLHNFLTNFGYKLPPILVLQDNTSTIFLASNGRSNSDATRHVDIRYFWICDRVKRKQIELKHVITTLMIADILTKPVQGLLFVDLRTKLLGYN